MWYKCVLERVYKFVNHCKTNCTEFAWVLSISATKTELLFVIEEYGDLTSSQAQET